MTVAQDANAALVAYREIKSRILDLRYAAGEKLSETRLVAELGVGRSPIRTALARLKSEGWVAVSPQSGTYVTSPTDKEIEEVTELRTLLEMHVTRVATPRIPERELREMRAAFEALRRQPMALHLEDFLELDNLVHSAIYRAADNALIIGIVSNLLDKVQWIRRANSVSVARFELALDELGEIIAALEARDAERAALRMRDHIGNAANFCKSEERGVLERGRQRRLRQRAEA